MTIPASSAWKACFSTNHKLIIDQYKKTNFSIPWISDPANLDCNYIWPPFVAQIALFHATCLHLQLSHLLCKSSTLLTYVVVGMWVVCFTVFTQYNSRCKLVACESFRQKLHNVNQPLVALKCMQYSCMTNAFIVQKLLLQLCEVHSYTAII
jgi:hypothetical protein